jgi:hypothetical protein
MARQGSMRCVVDDISLHEKGIIAGYLFQTPTITE